MGGEKMPIKQAIPMVLAALVLVVGVSVVLTLLDLCIWVVWLGMALWASFGMSLDMKEILKTWCSAAFGIALGYCLLSGNMVLLGIAGVCVLVFIFGMVSGRFGFLCNNYTAIFLTCSTGSGLILEPIQLAASVVFGFLIFGVVPWGATKLMAKLKKPEEAAE